ncbi:MAG: hypothetical protein ACOC33_02195 [bacterium]
MKNQIKLDYNGKNIILTHNPLKEFDGINIYGTDSDALNNQYSVAINRIQYVPIHINDLLKD